MSENNDNDDSIEEDNSKEKKLDENELSIANNDQKTNVNPSIQKSISSKLDSLTREDLLVYVKNLCIKLNNVRKNFEECQNKLNEKEEEIKTFFKNNAKDNNEFNADNSITENLIDNISAQKINILTMELQDYKKNLETTREALKLSNDQISEKELVTKEILQKLNQIEEEKENALENLQQTNSQLKKLQLVLEEKSGVISKNSKEIASLVTQISETKNDMEDEIQRLNQTILSKSDEINKLKSQNEFTLESLKKTKTELEYSNQSYQDLTKEFILYKDRAEYVLKQQKNDQNFSDVEKKVNETKPMEVQQLLETIDLKNQKINELMEKNTILEEKYQLAFQQTESIKIEFDLLNEKNANLSTLYDNYKKNLIADYNKQIENYKKEINKLNNENINLTQSFQKQSTDLEEKEKRRFEDLLKQNKKLEEELVNLKNQLKNDRPNKEILRNNIVTESDKQIDVLKCYNKNLANTNDDSLNKFQEIDENDLLTSLQVVVNDAVESNDKKSFNEEKNAIWENQEIFSDVEDLKHKLDKSNQQLIHLRELLADGEETNIKLEEQVKILKEEIRRIERDDERNNHITRNSEYLKNVILNFLAPQKVQEERHQIIPILKTMLKLSSEECTLLEKAINNTPYQNDNNEEKKEWSGYINSLWGMF